MLAGLQIANPGDLTDSLNTSGGEVILFVVLQLSRLVWLLSYILPYIFGLNITKASMLYEAGITEKTLEQHGSQ